MKHHCYALTFMSHAGGVTRVGTSYRGWATKKVSIKRINNTLAGSTMPADSVLLSVSYLGRMSEEEMMDLE